MDDLLDLDWQKQPAAAAANTTAQHSRPAAANTTAQHSRPAAASAYNFDALTRSMPATSPPPPVPLSQMVKTPNSMGAVMSPQSANRPPASSTDAFSSLLDFTSSSPSSSNAANATLSMADRQKAAAAASRSGAQKATASTSDWSSGADWEALAGGSSSARSNTATPTRQSSQAQTRKPPQPRPQPPTTPPADSFDFDAFDDPAPSAPSAPPARTASRTDPFDFADFEDPGAAQSSAFADGDGGDDDDLLGDLAKPVQPKAPPRPRQRQSPPTSAAPQRAVSPPPHIIGQIVEMGFSPVEARDALAKTSTGLDVEAALESLLAGAGAASTQAQDHELARRLQNEEGGIVDLEMEEYEERERQRRARRTQQQQQRPPQQPPRPAARSRPENTGEEAQADFDWQKQADQLYSQASEIGASVFSKANAFWTTAKAQAQKTLEERQNGSSGSTSPMPPGADASASASASRSQSPAVDSVAAARAWARRWGSKPAERKDWDGKPRWMVEAEAQEAAVGAGGASEPSSAEPAAAAASGGFKDSDNEDEAAPPFIPPGATRRQQQRPAAEAAARADVPETSPAAMFKAASGSNTPTEATGPKPYVSSARWGAKRQQGPAKGAAPPPPAPAPAPAVKPRSLIPEDLSSPPAPAVSKKADGNEAFKKGAYAEAEAAYTAALESLPDSSLRRIPLLNNRANTRLKNGDAPAASRDCGAVLAIILGGGADGKVAAGAMYEPSREAPLPSPLDTEVNLRDAYSKALLRRAQADEMLERWLPALKGWSLLEKYEKEQGSGAGTGYRNLKAAQEGTKRCQGMVSGGGAAAGRSNGAGAGGAAGPTKKEQAARRAAQAAASSAVRRAEEAGRERVRAAAAAQSAEDAAAHSLKDSIDARILGWKAGKDNIRALLASLDTVVWAELGWKKVGMHEVVTDAQVKKAYTRAIAKLHPDKLTPRNTTLEHRLLGAAVFSALNDAFAAAQSK